MRISTILLALTASVIGLPYQQDESSLDIQPSSEEFLALNDLQDLHFEDETEGNPNEGKISFEGITQCVLISKSRVLSPEISQSISKQNPAVQCPKTSTCDQLLQNTIKFVSNYMSIIPKSLLPNRSQNCHELMQGYFTVIKYISPWAPKLEDCDHDNDPKWLMDYWGCQKVRDISHSSL